MGQTLSSLVNTSSAVAQTSVGQTLSAMGQTLLSLGQTSSLTGQAARSLTSSNRATYVLANELSPIQKQTRAGVRRAGARGKTVTSSPYKADLSLKAPWRNVCRARKRGNQRRVSGWHQNRRNFRLDAKTAVYIRCTVCLRWAQCAGVNEEDDYFRCDHLC